MKPDKTTRLVVYNIAYGTGAPVNGLGRILTSHRYIRTSPRHINRLLDFLESINPDILGLLEIDTGSGRTQRVNQVELIANRLRHHYRCSVKYGQDSVGRRFPILRHQANAILTREESSNVAFHYFPIGFKRLIIEAEVGATRFFLVHLALSRRIRSRQLAALSEIASGEGPVVIAGDFNTLSGPGELDSLRSVLNLESANAKSLPTYPSWRPKRELDFILHSKDISVQKLAVPQIPFSDHLPLIMDFEIAPYDPPEKFF